MHSSSPVDMETMARDPPGRSIGSDETSAPLLMNVNGDTARYTSMAEEVLKKPTRTQHHNSNSSNGHGKGRHGRKGRRN